MQNPRILIPEPTSNDPEYNQRGWQQYADAVAQAGGVPVAVPLHASQEEQAQLIAGAQGVLLPGSHADVNPEKWNEPLNPRSAPADPLREAADELLQLIAGDGFDPAARLGIYRNNVITRLTDTLSATYPVVSQIVDARFFAYAATNAIGAESQRHDELPPAEATTASSTGAPCGPS